MHSTNDLCHDMGQVQTMGLANAGGLKSGRSYRLQQGAQVGNLQPTTSKVAADVRSLPVASPACCMIKLLDHIGLRLTGLCGRPVTKFSFVEVFCHAQQKCKTQPQVVEAPTRGKAVTATLTPRA